MRKGGLEVATKGYVVLRYSSPRKPTGIYDEWYSSLMMVAEEEWPKTKAAGAVSWRGLRDMLGNSPRNMLIIDFTSVDYAMEWLISPERKKFIERLLEIGTLDLNVSVYRLHSEG